MSRLNPGWSSVERYWLEVVDASPLVLVRTLYGLVIFAWSLSVLPDFSEIFGVQGLHSEPTFDKYRVMSVFRWVDGDAIRLGTMTLLLGSSLAVATGRWVRVSLPLTWLLHASFEDISRPWGIGADGILLNLGVLLVIFAVLAPSSMQGRFADASGSRGLVPVWGLRLLQLQVAIAYIRTGGAKLQGNDWVDGSAVFHALATERYQRFVPPSFLLDNASVVKLMTWSVLAVELALGPALLWKRTRRWAVGVALLLHFSFGVFMQLGFFFWAMSIGILSFLPPEDARRLLDQRRRLMRRPSAVAAPSSGALSS